jgi:SOS regulatory protein LexA
VPPKRFDWRKSLKDARTALEAGDAKARAKLVKALDDAAQMAELCHDKLFDMEPGEVADDRFKDWKDFLKTLYQDSAKVYKTHTDLASAAEEEGLMTKFEAIRDATQKAWYGLNYMDVGSEQEGREAELVKLRELMEQLQSVVADLRSAWQVSGGDETSEDAETDEVVYVPRVGRIAAGIPNLADHSIEGYYPVPRELVGGGNDFYLLEVSGDSMVEAGITHGDLVVVHQQPEANNGEIVVAMTDGEATVKSFKLIDGHAWLVPYNPAFTATPFDESITIIGKVVAVLRKV